MGVANNVNESLVAAAVGLAQSLQVHGIVVYGDVVGDFTILATAGESGVRVIVATSRDDILALEQFSDAVIRIPSLEFNRSGQLKVSILLGLSRGIISPSDRLICLSGSRRRQALDSLVVVDVAGEFEFFSSQPEGIMQHIKRPDVFEALLNLALELGREGREGKPVGTIFVLGDHERVLQFSRQMVINPFGGISEEERNVMDENLKGSIREFSAIDGAFVIRDDGVVLAAGRHLDASGEQLVLRQGLGSRHLAAAGITATTEAVALVISESTGDVRIFDKGKIFMEIGKSTDTA
jgi:DNA integrity scanning protein DisA with diadenylate cyclase activity